MDLIHLRLKRFQVANFKSLKRVEVDNLHSLALFMGRNNAGKSNILDCFKFLADAAISFDHAFSTRGGKLTEVVFCKKDEHKIEFVFDFVLTPQKRAEVITRLFAGNKLMTLDDALASSFLKVLTLKVTIGKDLFSEELLATNLLEESPAALIFSIKGTRQKTEFLSGCLDSLCPRCEVELPSERREELDVSQAGSTPFRLRLGKPEADGGFPISYELADMVHQQFALLQWVDPLRRLPTSSPIQGHLMLASDASNLPDVLHWVLNNKPKLFRKIEAEVSKLVPQLGRLYTPTVENTATLGMIDSKDEDLVYSMDQMSFGTRSLVAIISKVVLAKPGTFMCIEEPETYLHPKAQLGLFHFLRNESANKTIFVATHSTSIAASCPLDSLFIVQRDGASCTVAVPVTEANTKDIIEQLGVRPGFSFEAETIVFVEDEDAIPVLEAWAKKFGIRVKLQFLNAEGASTLHYYANARVAFSKFVHTLVFAVFVEGEALSEECRSVQQKVVKDLDLPSNQVISLDAYGVEGYLLNPKAILKAFPAISLSETELETRLAPARTEPNPKTALRDLLAEFKMGEYEGSLGARIAEAMEEIPAKVLLLFERIDIASKPFWRI